MRKYLIKFTALSTAALLGVCALASCGGSQADESTTPEKDATETVETTEEQVPESGAKTDSTEAVQ